MASEPNGQTPPALDQIKGMGPPGDGGEEIMPSFDFPGMAAAPPAVAAPAAPAVKVLCPCCQAVRRPQDAFCGDCGWHFKDPYPEGEAALVTASEAAPLPPAAPIRVKERYELDEQTGEKLGIERFKGRDLGLSGTDNVPIIIVRQVAAEEQPAVVATPIEGMPIEAVPVAKPDDEVDFMPSFDDVLPTSGPATEVLPTKPAWPSVAWERDLLDSIEHPGLPSVLDTFFEDGYQYLIEEVPQGQSLWDAWDDREASNQQRFGHLIKVAEIMQTMHRLGAMVEGIRPDIIVVDDRGEARITDLSDLLPLPVPADAPVRGTMYTAPELVATPERTDPRADLYSFGALVLALNLGHELTEKQFLKPGNPKPIFNDYPDMHPALGRLMMKTFARQIEARFPTDEAVKEDATGFTELIKTLKVCGRTMDQCRLEVAAWTTTGMIRTGNEDAFALLHSCESRQDDFADSALIMLADGMGGYDAGEVAAAMCISQLRKYMTALRPFNSVAGATGFPTEHPQSEGNAPAKLEVDDAKRMVRAAMKDANKFVFTSARTPGGPGRRGMGCTAEVVYIDGRDVVVGHVGDSRTYILSEGNFIQMTRDQTLVNRLVELGTLSADEAENHPRKNELQQAMGGQPDVEPGIYHARLKPGDFVLVCSDGLTNHIKDKMLQQFLKVEAVSAELAARRLVNLVNIEGATDNATVVIVRAT